MDGLESVTVSLSLWKATWQVHIFVAWISSSQRIEPTEFIESRPKSTRACFFTGLWVKNLFVDRIDLQKILTHSISTVFQIISHSLHPKKNHGENPKRLPSSHRASPAFGGSHHLHSRHSASWRRFPPWPGGQKLILRTLWGLEGPLIGKALFPGGLGGIGGSQKKKHTPKRSLTARKNPWKMLGRKKQIRLPLVLDGNFSGASC